MKYIILLGFLFSYQMCVAQTPEKLEIQNTIEEFFEAFHQQDSLKLRAMAVPEITMQSIGLNKDGEAVLNTSQFGQFLKSIVSIPKDKTFEEKILGYTINIDGAMANAWTPYEFWYDGNFSHCGVNSFQLMKVNSKWKLLYIVDTRRKECDF